MERVFAVSCLLLLSVSCTCAGGDTCSGGSTFTRLALDPAFALTPSSQQLNLRFGPGTGPAATLPPTYFAAAVPKGVMGLDGGSGVTAVRAADAGILQLELDVPVRTRFEVSLELPDRRGFIDCSHPGMMDSYNLDLKLSQSPDGGYELRSEEKVQLGAI